MTRLLGDNHPIFSGRLEDELRSVQGMKSTGKLVFSSIFKDFNESLTDDPANDHANEEIERMNEDNIEPGLDDRIKEDVFPPDEMETPYKY